jgi:TRAP-type C4-dicarboxylate transport system substrate-binding protein
MKTLKFILAGVACVTGTTALVSGAAAQEPIILKFAMAVPPNHFTATAGGKFFMDRAVELSKGKIKFEWYPGEQLGKAKDLLALVQSGVADMADVVPSYVSDKLPLTGVSELPGQMVNSCEGTKAYYAMTRPGSLLGQKEFTPQKVRVLMAAPLVPYKILTSKKQVQTLEDMVGLKIRSSGGASDSTIRALGAVSVRLSGPEINESLMRGTIDGAMYPFMSLKPFGLTESIKYSVAGASVGTLSTLFLINDAKYKKLPADIQQALDQAGKEAGENYCNYMDTHEAKEREALTAIKTVQLSTAEAARWDALLAVTKKEWANNLDKRGKSGSEALSLWDVEMKKVRSGN